MQFRVAKRRKQGSDGDIVRNDAEGSNPGEQGTLHHQNRGLRITGPIVGPQVENVLSQSDHMPGIASNRARMRACRDRLLLVGSSE